MFTHICNLREKGNAGYQTGAFSAISMYLTCVQLRTPRCASVTHGARDILRQSIEALALPFTLSEVGTPTKFG